ncbi:MAG TPA: apolipoprotein N-acyltransferase [Nitrospiraceae bacterium]|nr:apolipoprotein N-acyltransferase [Nitrospiraceae bacterium]
MNSLGELHSQALVHEPLRGKNPALVGLHGHARLRVITGCLLALLSAGLIACSLPNPDVGWLAWIALVPLMVACATSTPVQGAALGFLAGMAANAGTYHWLFEVNGFELYHFLILSSFFALYPAAWAAGTSYLTRARFPLIFVAPALWVLVDYLRAHAGFMAFPWGTLAQTQHQNLSILQIATVTGEYGVTFLVVMGNAALAGIILHAAWRPAAGATILIVLVHLGGALALTSPQPGPSVRLAAVQPSIRVGERHTEAGRAAARNRLARLTEAAAASHPALIVWPETAVVGNLRANPFLAMELTAFASDLRTPIVFGVGEVDKFVAGGGQRQGYNAAYLVTEQGLSPPYIKRVLLPFGEYVPLEHIIGWPAWLAPSMYRRVPGNVAVVYTVSDTMAFSPLICWENLFADLARESVREGAGVLVMMSNDGWFGRTAEPLQHNLPSVLRAVENRVPVVVASNTGPSKVVDAYGRVVARAPGLFEEDVVIGEVALGAGGTLYTRIGDVFAFIVIGAFAFAMIRRWRETTFHK